MSFVQQHKTQQATTTSLCLRQQQRTSRRSRLSIRCAVVVSNAILTALLTVAIVLGAGVSTYAMADGEQRTRVEAIDIAKQRSGNNGRVLSVKKKVDADGISVFAVKIISDGRVKVYSVREFK